MGEQRVQEDGRIWKNGGYGRMEGIGGWKDMEE